MNSNQKAKLNRAAMRSKFKSIWSEGRNDWDQVMCIDLGTKSGVVTSTTDKIYRCEQIDTSKCKNENERWRMFRNSIGELLSEDVTCIVFEDVRRFLSYDSARRFLGLLAMLELCAGDRAVFPAPIRAAKISLTGDAKASKSDMIEHAKRVVCHIGDWTEDEADAIGLLHWFFGLEEEKLEQWNIITESTPGAIK